MQMSEDRRRELPMRDFSNRAAFVTVVYKSRRADAERVAAGIAAHGGKALALAADVGDSAAVAAAFARARDAFGGIKAKRYDIAVNPRSVGTLM
jgi:NAD(P)-dependent dehydrogenase (short-subunit alcohol dehydrogenase family)